MCAAGGQHCVGLACRAYHKLNFEYTDDEKDDIATDPKLFGWVLSFFSGMAAEVLKVPGKCVECHHVHAMHERRVGSSVCCATEFWHRGGAASVCGLSQFVTLTGRIQGKAQRALSTKAPAKGPRRAGREGRPHRRGPR